MPANTNGLIEVYKVGNEDEKLYADQRQVDANPKALMPWPPKAKGAKAKDEGDEGGADEERAKLEAEANELGVSTHPNMKTATLKKKIAEAKADKK